LKPKQKSDVNATEKMWFTEKKSTFCSVGYLLQAGFLLGLSFNPENGSGMFLRSVDSLSTDYTAL
jgi:hypothetical protein